MWLFEERVPPRSPLSKNLQLFSLFKNNIINQGRWVAVRGPGMPHLAVTWLWLLCSSQGEGGRGGLWHSASNNVSIVCAGGQRCYRLGHPQTRQPFRVFYRRSNQTTLTANGISGVNMKNILMIKGEKAGLKMHNWSNELIWRGTKN